MEFHAIVRQEDGSYWAEVQELPGCFASGKDLNELQEALIEAIGLCLTAADRARIDSDGEMRVGGITVATGPLVPA